MKKRIKYLVMILLLTGCTCEYNLTIDDDDYLYKEEVVILAENEEELNDINANLQIPVDKNYILGADSDSVFPDNIDFYNTSVENNKMIFRYDFTRKGLINSSAVYNCFERLIVNNYDNNLIISTNSKANCFINTPPLTNVKINIKTELHSKSE